MIVRDHGAGGRWLVFAASYPSALMARRAWERAERKLDLSAGDEGIGLYRLAPNPEGGIESGSNAHAVAVVTLDELTMRKAQRLLGDGESWDPTTSFADALIARRAQVVLSHAGETGRLMISATRGQGREARRAGRHARAGRA